MFLVARQAVKSLGEHKIEASLAHRRQELLEARAKLRGAGDAVGQTNSGRRWRLSW